MSDRWYQNAVFYEVYVRAFCDSDGDGHGDLAGLTQKLDYLKSLGVDCIWLMPIYPSPLRDDGYDIADYYNILQTYGTLEDFRCLVTEIHTRGMRIITDLVLNHISDQHPWFQTARTDRHSPFRDYFVWSDTDQKFRDARIIFLDTEKSNWTWDEQAGQYFWHRFYSTQPDLNYDNPAVQKEMLHVAKHWLDLGVDGFRADAVPYLIEREGTNCENLPETHAYLKLLRRFIDENYTGRILLCEANQWPEDVRPYFGEGDEFQLGFHFPVMPRIFKALRSGLAAPVIEILNRTPPIPASCQWCTFLRNHDELTLEMVSEEDRQWMWREYAPDPRMRLNLGIRRRLAPLLDNDRRKIELANSLLLTLPGSPVLYYGDEIGMGDNIWLEDRNGVRTPMQWTAEPGSGFSTASPDRLYTPLISDSEFAPARVNVAVQQADPDSLLNTLRGLISLRKKHKAFSLGELSWVELAVPDASLLAYHRTFEQETVLALHNLSAEPRRAALCLLPETQAVRDLRSGEMLQMAGGEVLELTLAPFEFRWLEELH